MVILVRDIHIGSGPSLAADGGVAQLDSSPRDLRDDPRADPRMVAALAPFGLDRRPPPLPVSAASPREALLDYAAQTEANFGGLFDALLAGLAPVEGVSRQTVTVAGHGGNDILLRIHRPASRPGDATLPCVVQFHGGGGVILSTLDSCYERWRDELAAQGAVVIGVEFRNAAGNLGNHPYPAGLEDCAAATVWALEHRAELGVDTVVVSGESGGGNLALGVALKAAREQWGYRPDGVYALAPMIASPWDKPAALPSQRENDGYLISCALLAVMGALYDPLAAHATDALCWPYHAGDAELVGLPPHVISVNELDPLRDEGQAYQRRLVRNGVSAVGRVVMGTVHTADVFFRAAMPDVYAATIRDICGFAREL
jgi:acetyl esterase/lipase